MATYPFIALLFIQPTFHSSIHPFNLSIIHPFLHLFINYLPNHFNHFITHSVIQPTIHSFIQSTNHPLIHSFTYPSIHSSMYLPMVCPFISIHPFIIHFFTRLTHLQKDIRDIMYIDNDCANMIVSTAK